MLSHSARIHSNSWGLTSQFGEYTSNAREVDQFTFEKKDFLVLFAAGNRCALSCWACPGRALSSLTLLCGTLVARSGDEGLYSVSSPSTSKNCISVGASQNTKTAAGRYSRVPWPVQPLSAVCCFATRTAGFKTTKEYDTLQTGGFLYFCRRAAFGADYTHAGTGTVTVKRFSDMCGSFTGVAGQIALVPYSTSCTATTQVSRGRACSASHRPYTHTYTHTHTQAHT